MGALLWLGATPPPDSPGGWVAWQGAGLGAGLIAVFALLHLSSNYLQARLVTLVWRLTGNSVTANRVYFTLLRPGVLVHEVGHAIAAALVGGRIVAFNALETEVVAGPHGPQVRLGHVSYAIPGRAGALGTRLRDAAVGLAPLPFGLLLIAGALALSGVDWLGDLPRTVPPALGTARFWLAGLAILEIADQMIPSHVDRKNWPVALLVLLGAVLLGWLAAQVLRFSLSPAVWTALLQALAVLGAVLIVPIALNLLVGLLLWAVTRILGRPYVGR